MFFFLLSFIFFCNLNRYENKINEGKFWTFCEKNEAADDPKTNLVGSFIFLFNQIKNPVDVGLAATCHRLHHFHFDSFDKTKKRGGFCWWSIRSSSASFGRSSRTSSGSLWSVLLGRISAGPENELVLSRSSASAHIGLCLSLSTTSSMI